jgi:hypothetical protein
MRATTPTSSPLAVEVITMGRALGCSRADRVAQTPQPKD